MRCCIGCGTGVFDVITWKADDLALKCSDMYTKSEIVAIFGSRRLTTDDCGPLCDPEASALVTFVNSKDQKICF